MLENQEGVGAPEQAPEERPEGKTPLTEVYDWFQCIVSALIICVLIFVFFSRMIGVIGSSMVPTLHEGDRVVISNLFYEPAQGDIVVLREQSYRDEPIVKRVIATEGQVVELDFDNGFVYVNGQRLSEPYVAEQMIVSLDYDEPVTVPDGCVYVMGDNRNNSTDSRDARIGCVDIRCIMGRVLFRILPLSDFGKVN